MKNKIYLLLTLVLFIASVKTFAYTNKSGTISSVDIWSDTIHITGDITIPQNGHVIINPGTFIQAQGFYYIKITQTGRITALGTAIDSIKFVPLSTATKWNGIRFENMSQLADSSVFWYCSFQSSKGAIYINKFDKVSISNCCFANNLTDISGAHGNGGGVYGDSSLVVINNSVFKNNYAGYGGGLYFSYSNVIINNSRVTRNHSYWTGGGIYCDMSHLQFTNCLLDSNYQLSSGGGGGLGARLSDVTFTDCKLTNNKQNAIYAFYAGGKLRVENTIISNNEGSQGGGINGVGVALTIINSTIVNNKPDAGSKTGGIYSYYCHPVKVSNCILWNNAGLYPDLYYENQIPTISNCDIKDGNLLNIPSPQFINNISIDPKFSNPSANVGISNDALGSVWDLMSCSPCINKGDSSLLDSVLLVDYNNNPRIFNDTIDIGACEFQSIQSPPGGTKIVYVSPNGTGDGSSWLNAMGDLQDAINTTQNCYDIIEVWVVTGTYYPDTIGQSDVRASSFLLKDNVKIFGGFTGNEVSLNQRNWVLNPTILSGNIGDSNDSTDNVYHVVYAANVNHSAVLDGFIVRDGFASYTTYNNENGGGIYCSYSSPDLNNLMIRNNTASNNGGGMYLDFSNATISNSAIYKNMTYGNGGGIYFNYSHARIINSQIIDNYMFMGFYGGGIVANYSNPYFINSIIANNVNDGYSEGGGMYCNNANPVIINSVFANNTCGGTNDGAGIFAYSNSHPVIFNSIFWNNQDPTGTNHFAMNSGSTTTSFNVQSSLIQGGNIYNIPVSQFANNINEAPRFLHPSIIIGLDDNVVNADWGLFPCSPCINHGDSALFPDTINYDMALHNRIFNDSIDIGPYELQGNPTGLAAKNIIYVKPGTTGNGTAWNNAIGNLQQAIDLPFGCYETSEIWVASGTYLPDITGLVDIKLATFTIRNNHHLYGGFAGYEDSLSQRDWTINKSVLSGNVGSIADSMDNSNNVVFISQQDTAIFDGFVIKNGYSNDYYHGGGAIFCENSTVKFNNLTLSNNTSENNAGGLYAKASDLDIKNSLITSNTADQGTAISLISSKMNVENCKILNNLGNNGTGGVLVSSSKGKIINCLISNNYGENAGAISSYQSNYSVVNSTLTNNKCIFGGPGGISTSDTLFILNSILWDNGFGGSTNQITYTNGNLLKIQNCDIKNGANLNIPALNYINNLDADPKFLSPNNTIGNYNLAEFSNWSLHNYSPCVDSGFYNSVYVTTSIDIAGNPRVYNGTIDIGAFEYQGNEGIHSYNNDDIISLFPNPATDNIIIEILHKSEIEISNIEGQTIKRLKTKDNKKDIDISDFVSGVYIIRAQTDSGITTRKFIKE